MRAVGENFRCCISDAVEITIVYRQSFELVSRVTLDNAGSGTEKVVIVVESCKAERLEVREVLQELEKRLAC